LNKQELVADVAHKTGAPKSQVTDIVDATFDAIAEAMKKNDEVRLPNFGVFAVVETAARKARNPQTGEEVKVPAGRRPRFRPGKALKDLLETPKVQKR